MNDFPVDLHVVPSGVDHKGTLQVIFARDPSPEQVAMLNGLVDIFREACTLGFLSGALVNPRHSQINEFSREPANANVFRVRFDFQGIEGQAFRVLVKIIRGEPLLDGILESLSIHSESSSSKGSTENISNEEEIGLPKVYGAALPFELIKAVDGRATIDRLIRVRFYDRPRKDLLGELVHIEKVWLAVGKGGWVTAPKKAHECFTFADEGYLISPKVFEIYIDMLENPEAYFDPFLNGLIKFAVTRQSIKSVHIQ